MLKRKSHLVIEIFLVVFSLYSGQVTCLVDEGRELCSVISRIFLKYYYGVGGYKDFFKYSLLK